MTKQLLITIGIVIILLTLAVWVYILIFGTPTSPDDVFTDLGLDEQPARDVPIVEETPPVTILGEQGGLQQLTLRAVAGYVPLIDGTRRIVRFVEQGTGHIYDLDLDAKTETRRTQTTMARTQSAIFSENGTTVALTAVQNGIRSSFVGTMTNDGTLIGTDLPPQADNVYVFENGTAAYTLTDSGGSEGVIQTASGTAEVVLSIPLTSFHLLWGETATATHYVATKPAQQLKNFVYELRGNQLRATPLLGYGLLVERGDPHFLITRFDADSFEPLLFDQTTATFSNVPIVTVPEKCDVTGKMVCAAPYAFDNDDVRALFPDTWYRGAVTSADVLWELSTTTTGVAATVISDLSEEAGRVLDVTDLTTTADLVFFRNRIDNTLWLYE